MHFVKGTIMNPQSFESLFQNINGTQVLPFSALTVGYRLLIAVFLGVALSQLYGRVMISKKIKSGW